MGVADDADEIHGGTRIAPEIDSETSIVQFLHSDPTLVDIEQQLRELDSATIRTLQNDCSETFGVLLYGTLKTQNSGVFRVCADDTRLSIHRSGTGTIDEFREVIREISTRLESPDWNVIRGE